MRVNREYTDTRVIKSYTISDVTRADMHKMTCMLDKVMKVLGTHLEESTKKEYLSDDDLYSIAAILSVFTEDNRVDVEKSVFDERKELIIKNHKELLDARIASPVCLK